MTVQLLDNPIWHSLLTRQADFAIGDKQVKRYPSEIGPFIAVPTPEVRAGAQFSKLIAAGESMFLVGVAPKLPSEWQLKELTPIVQMLSPNRIETPAHEPEICVLSDPDLPAMLELTALVYPEFFRTRTLELGAYSGIYVDGRLAAMAGERMHLTGYREISAVCTHPDFTGRRFAAALVKQVTNAILDRNEVPFLHVSRNNERAKSLYERLGFIARCELPLWAVRAQS